MGGGSSSRCRRQPTTQQPPAACGLGTDHLYESINPTEHQEASQLSDLAHPSAATTSTPMPVFKRREAKTASAFSARQHECLHRLLSLEFEFIDFMHYGTERFSRPLRHCILSGSQHTTIFQNVEKLVTISGYHVKQMQAHSSDTDTSAPDSSSSSSYPAMSPQSVALTYASKLHMLCQAYETYAAGLGQANASLQQLRRNQDFLHFIREPCSDDGQAFQHMTLSSFINRPVAHIQAVWRTLGEVLQATPPTAPDFPVLQNVVLQMSRCVGDIANLSSQGRVYSLGDIASSTCSTTTCSTTTCSDTDYLRPMMVMMPPHEAQARVQERRHARGMRRHTDRVKTSGIL